MSGRKWVAVEHARMNDGVVMYWLAPGVSLGAADPDDAAIAAAAPELLDACETLLERYRIMVASDGPECLMAIAAIAKARGEA